MQMWRVWLYDRIRMVVVNLRLHHMSLHIGNAVMVPCSYSLHWLFWKSPRRTSADIKLTCSSESCSRSSRQWSIVEFKSGEHQQPIEQKIALSTNKEGMKRHPVLFFSSMGRTYRKDRAVVSISAISADDERQQHLLLLS